MIFDFWTGIVWFAMENGFHFLRGGEGAREMEMLFVPLKFFHVYIRRLRLNVESRDEGEERMTLGCTHCFVRRIRGTARNLHPRVRRFPRPLCLGFAPLWVFLSTRKREGKKRKKHKLTGGGIERSHSNEIRTPHARVVKRNYRMLEGGGYVRGYVNKNKRSSNAFRIANCLSTFPHFNTILLYSMGRLLSPLYGWYDSFQRTELSSKDLT